MVLHLSHAEGGFGVTLNDITKGAAGVCALKAADYDENNKYQWEKIAKDIQSKIKFCKQWGEGTTKDESFHVPEHTSDFFR
jgi:hypothetical protein